MKTTSLTLHVLVSFALLVATPAARATVDPVTRIDAFEETTTGLVMKLDRPLSTGETEVSAARLGFLLSDLIDGVGMLGPADVDTFAVTLLRNYEVTEFGYDPRLTPTFRGVEDVLRQLPLTPPRTSALLDADVRHAYLGLRLIEAHAAVGTEAANLELRDLLANWIAGRVMFHQSNADLLPNGPSDDHLVQTLVDLARGPGLGAATREFWPLLMSRLESQLGATPSGSTARLIRALRMRWTFAGGALSGLLGVGALPWLLHVGTDAQGLALGAGAVLGGTFLGMGVGNGLFRGFEQNRIFERDRAEVRAFLDRCERGLVEEAASRENSNAAPDSDPA